MKKKVLFTATVVKTHIRQFHIPYLQMFRQMGWETAVAARNDYENPADCQIPFCDHYYDIPMERMPWNPSNWRAFRMLRELIAREEYDIIHCHTPVGAMLTRLAAISARKKGTKVVYTAHGFHFFKGAAAVNWLLYYPVERLLAPLTDVLITINREDYALAKKKMPAKRVEYVAGVGIDTEKFRQDPAARGEKRRELGFRDSDFLILTVAEMTPNKNHITTLNALARIRDTEEFQNIHYLICGRGEMRESLEKSAARLGIAEHVHFLGYRSDVPELYGCCDLFSFLSFREGLPVALMEAMSSGMGVVCTKIRGNTDLVEDGVSGLFVENQPEAAAAAFLKLYRDPELRSRLGQGAAEKAKMYDEKNVHQRMKDIYLSLK